MIYAFTNESYANCIYLNSSEARTKRKIVIKFCVFINIYIYLIEIGSKDALRVHFLHEKALLRTKVFSKNIAAKIICVCS